MIIIISVRNKTQELERGRQMKNVRENWFSVFVKRQGKKAGKRVGKGFENPKEAIKEAMARYDGTNTVYVKQAWYNPKSCYTGDVKVYEFNGTDIWFEDVFSAEMKSGKYNA